MVDLVYFGKQYEEWRVLWVTICHPKRRPEIPHPNDSQSDDVLAALAVEEEQGRDYYTPEPSSIELATAVEPTGGW